MNIFVLIFSIVSGSIELLGYETMERRSWPVYSDCDAIRIQSTRFKLYQQDYVQINEILYFGNTGIDSILSSNFTLVFQSYENNGDDSKHKKGFALNWTCLNWSEWSRTETCTEISTFQPAYTGPDIKYRLRFRKYRKIDETCGKLYHAHKRKSDVKRRVCKIFICY